MAKYPDRTNHQWPRLEANTIDTNVVLLPKPRVIVAASVGRYSQNRWSRECFAHIGHQLLKAPTKTPQVIGSSRKANARPTIEITNNQLDKVGVRELR